MADNRQREEAKVERPRKKTTEAEVIRRRREVLEAVLKALRRTA
jgi:hypothetical protein